MDRIHGIERLFAVKTRRVVNGKRFCIELFHHAEAAELALLTVPVAVMVTIFRSELAIRKRIDNFHASHDLNGKGQAARPARRGLTLIFKVKARGRRVLYKRPGARVVVSFVEKIWLGTTGQVQELVGAVGKYLFVISPEDSCRACS